MKTTIIRTIKKGRQIAAILSLSAMLMFTADAFAQQKELLQAKQGTASATGTLQANIFPSPDPLMLKIVFDNPAREAVTLTVSHAENGKIYTKVISPTLVYNSKLDVSGLPDGKYTFEISSKNKRFLQSFEIFTQTARLTQVQ
jgi:hypothetical protein